MAEEDGITKEEALNILNDMLQECVDTNDEMKGQALLMAILAVAHTSDKTMDAYAEEFMFFILLKRGKLKYE